MRLKLFLKIEENGLKNNFDSHKKDFSSKASQLGEMMTPFWEKWRGLGGKRNFGGSPTETSFNLLCCFVQKKLACAIFGIGV